MNNYSRQTTNVQISQKFVIILLEQRNVRDIPSMESGIIESPSAMPTVLCLQQVIPPWSENKIESESQSEITPYY